MNGASIRDAIRSAAEHHRAGRLRQAEEIYRQVLQADPNHPDALHLLGVIHSQTGKPAAGEELIRRAIAVKPGVADFHSNLGVALGDQGKVDEAVATLRRALQLRPDHADACNNLGSALTHRGAIDEAVACLQRAIQLRPDYPDAFNNLGVALAKQEKFDQAAAAYRKALELNPRHASANHNLGKVLQHRGKLDEAVACYRRAIELQPNHGKAHISLAAALCLQGRLDEAVACSRRSLDLEPRSADAWSNLGFALNALGEYQEAISTFRRAIALQSDHLDAHFNLGLTLLLVGDLEQGWTEYEWRWRNSKLMPQSLRNLPGPRWKGEDLGGRTVLVHGEQGMGDLIQFCRYAPLIVARGGRVLLVCHPPLKGLLQRVEGVSQVFVKGETTSPFSFHVPILNLPGVFGTTLRTIPARIPYVTPDPGLVQTWRDRLPPTGGKLRVGLVWAGSPGHKNDRNRSCPLQAFAPLAEVAGVTFYSLQKGRATGQALAPPHGMEMVDLASQLKDFSDTAAFVANLDLVISVDTAVVHLAGAMGKPVWTLLPFNPDWRWLLNRPDSPWYPTMRLFRQPRSGDWESVMRDVGRELASADKTNLSAGPGGASSRG